MDKIINMLTGFLNSKPGTSNIVLAILIAVVLSGLVEMSFLFGHAVVGLVLYFTARCAKDKFLRAFDYKTDKK